MNFYFKRMIKFIGERRGYECPSAKLDTAQHWPSSGSSTFRTGCHSKNDNRLGIGPILGQVSAEGR